MREVYLRESASDSPAQALRAVGHSLCPRQRLSWLRTNNLKEDRMARNPQVAVEPRPDGRWAVQTDGTQRADSLHDRKSDAITRGRELAGNKQTELVIKGADGRIQGKDSKGSDSRKIRG